MRRWWTGIVIVLALTALACGIRLYKLTEIPYGLHSDEAANGLDTFDVLNGYHPIFFERNNGREPLFIYLQSLSVARLGATPFALRLPAALIGAATVPAVFWMARAAFMGSDLPAAWLALWTALLVAVSYWHVSFSRFGYRGIMVPLLASLTFGCFWLARRAVLTGSRFPWVSSVIGGLCLGGSLYTYTAGRVTPVLFVIVAGAGILLVERGSAGAALRGRLLLSAAIMALVGLVVFLPLGVYGLQHPANFMGRQAAISALNPAANGGNTLGMVAQGIARTAGQFGILGDDKLRLNPANRPVFTVQLAVWLIFGLAVALRRSRSLPYLFAVAWLAMFALPAALSVEALPHTLRSLGMLPIAYMVPVIGMLVAGRWLGRRFGRAWLALWLPLPFVLWAGAVDLRDYLTVWQSNAYMLQYVLNQRYLDTARYIEQHPQADTVWLLPAYPIFSAPDTKFTLDFLSARGSKFDWGVVFSSDGEGPQQLQNLTAGHHFANLIAWEDNGLTPDGVFAPVDAKGYLSFMLGKVGKPVAQGGNRELSYTTYALPERPDFQNSGSLALADVAFGDQVGLTGLDYGGVPPNPDASTITAASAGRSIPSGGKMWAVLRWRAHQPLANDLKVSLFLADAAGHIAGQADDALVGDRYLLEKTWPAGRAATTYHLVETLPAVPPGTYQLRAAVYRAAGGERLPVAAVGDGGWADSAALGTIEITPPVAPPQVQPAHLLAAPAELAPGLALAGYDLPGDTFSPGDTLPLTLYWQPGGASGRPYSVTVELRGPDGKTAAAAPGALLAGGWPACFTLRDWQDLSVPRDLPAGDYQLVVRAGQEGPGAAENVLQRVKIGGRPHVFAPPAATQPLAVAFSSGINLIGYDLNLGRVKSGDHLPLTLYWQARSAVPQGYTVFVHLLGPDGRVWAQHDNAPAAGSAPTNSWIAGEYITDGYDLTLNPEIPPGAYRIEVGLYNPATGARVRTQAAAGQQPADHVLLPQSVDVIQ
jgi:hypothetical protein